MGVKIIGNRELNHNNYCGLIYAGLLIGCFICCLVILKSGYAIGTIAATLPFILLAIFYIFRKPIILLFIFFLVNYLIMGVYRYQSIPLPATGIIDSILGLLMIAIVFKSSFDRSSWKPALNTFTWLSFIWFIYCFLEIFNNTAGAINIDAWYQGVRSIALYPLITAILVPLLFNNFKAIQWFMILWALLSIIGAAKGYWQRSRGFDSYEMAWLFNYGGRTHLINTGIRYFSFFTDASTYGASMGFSMVAFGISTIYSKSRGLKILFLIAALAGAYGMIISGTRGALAVPFAGVALFVLISRNWKMAASAICLLMLSIIFLKVTDIGNDNMFIRRMRSAFDLNDASLQTRIINRESISKDMQNLPVGLGIGVNPTNINSDNLYYSTAVTPPDSWYVVIWTRTGIVGLCIYLSILAFTIIYGSYLLMFKIKNKELKGISSGLLCGVFGVMVSAYGGDCYSQFPNGFLIYTCQTLVMISPLIDKKLSIEKESKKQIKQTELT